VDPLRKTRERKTPARNYPEREFRAAILWLKDKELFLSKREEIEIRQRKIKLA
jgi:hypothetical protein